MSDAAPELFTHLGWLAKGEQWFTDRVGLLDDAVLGRPSRLPGWTRAHVIAHVARNADALTNLVSWARTGVETPMYAQPGVRERDIASGAMQEPSILRKDLAQAQQRLLTALQAMPAENWDRRVRSARGRDLPATQIPWLRVREVWIHSLDLDPELRADSFPPPLVDTLISDVAHTLSVHPDVPGVVLAPTDRARSWRLGQRADQRAPIVRAPADELLAWIIGRAGQPPSGPAVVLPSWL